MQLLYVAPQNPPSIHNSALEPGPHRRHRWAGLAVFFAALILYGATAAPSIVELFDDSLEFQLVGPTLGIAHPTGYPLYVISSFLWSRVLFPLGNWAWRMNLFSVIFAAGTVALLFHLTSRLASHADGRPNGWAGAAAAVTFGLGPTWHGQATIAEVYALHNFLVVAILNTTIGVNATATGQSARGAPLGRAFSRRMTLLALLVGCGLAHHRTITLVLPGLAVYLLWSVPGIWRPQRAWLIWLLALLAPLLLYALLPLRAAAGVSDLNSSYVNTFSGFLDHVLARRYVGFFGTNALAVERDVAAWLTLFRNQIGLPALLLALLGAAWLFDARGRLAKAWFFVLLVLLANLLFAVNYRVGDVEVFLLPVMLCLAIFAGGGVGICARLIETRLGGTTRRWAVGLVQVFLIATLASGVGGRGLVANRSQDWAVHDYAVALAKVPFPPDARVVGLEGEMTALRYMQQAEGLGRNATPVVVDDPTQRAAAIARLIDAGQPVYVTREVAGIEDLYSFGAQGPLVRVWPRGEAQAGQPAHALEEEMADGALRLIGYDATILEQAGGPALALALYWLPEQPLVGNYKLSLRVLDEAGAPLLDPAGEAIVADRFPLRQVAPTRSWLVGETIRDEQIVNLTQDWARQAATLLVIVYDADSIAEVGRWTLDLGPLRP
jgi:hypothetical protein